MNDAPRDKVAYVMASGSVPGRQGGETEVTFGELDYDSNADEVAYILDDSDSKAIFVDASLGDVLTDLQANLPAVVESCFVVGGAVEGYEPLDEAIASQP